MHLSMVSGEDIDQAEVAANETLERIHTAKAVVLKVETQVDDGWIVISIWWSQ